MNLEKELNELKIWVVKPGLKMSDCLTAQNNRALMFKHGSEEIKNAVVDIMLIKMSLFSVKYQMNDYQISFFAETFIEDYPADSITDLCVCINDAAKGKHGEILHAIDPSIVLGWYKKHLEIKAEIQERNRAEKRKQQNKELENPNFDPKVTETIKKILEKVKPKPKKSLIEIRYSSELKKWNLIKGQLNHLDENYLVEMMGKITDELNELNSNQDPELSELKKLYQNQIESITEEINN